MPHVSYESGVNAPAETAWNMIVEKTEHPERFYPGIRDVKILERSAGGIVRCVKTQDGDVRTERLVLDEEHLQVTATLIDHPVYSGTTVCQVSVLDEGPLLRCNVNWSPIAGVEPPDPPDVGSEVLSGLKSVVDRAEGRCPKWLANSA